MDYHNGRGGQKGIVAELKSQVSMDHDLTIRWWGIKYPGEMGDLVSIMH